MIRASMLGKLMASPDKDVLPVGAITELDKIISQKLLNWEDDFDFNTLEKGRLCEQESIDLYNELRDEFYIKNIERVTKGDLTGECDLLDKKKSLIIDIKTAYSKKTFPINLKLSSLYEWQLRAYMYLYDVNHAELAYCLVDTPQDLINRRDLAHWHDMSDVPQHLKLSTISISRDLDLESKMLNRIELSMQYINESLNRGQ